MDMSLPSDEDLLRYPHAEFDSDVPWDPTKLDDEYNMENVLPTVDELIHVDPDTQMDVVPLQDEEFKDLLAETYTTPLSVNVNFMFHNQFEDYVMECLREVNFKKVSRNAPNLDEIGPNLGFTPENRMVKTIENTTQFGRLDHRWPMCHHFKSRCPAYNVNRLNDKFATDAIMSSFLLQMMASRVMLDAKLWHSTQDGEPSFAKVIP
jgi:hypothetical protein